MKGSKDAFFLTGLHFSLKLKGSNKNCCLCNKMSYTVGLTAVDLK